MVRHHRGATLGLAIVAPSGTDRTKSRVAGGEAVPLEFAVVERRLLRDAIGRGRVGGDARGKAKWENFRDCAGNYRPPLALLKGDFAALRLMPRMLAKAP